MEVGGLKLEVGGGQCRLRKVVGRAMAADTRRRREARKGAGGIVKGRRCEGGGGRQWALAGDKQLQRRDTIRWGMPA